MTPFEPIREVPRWKRWLFRVVTTSRAWHDPDCRHENGVHYEFLEVTVRRGFRWLVHEAPPLEEVG